ncbi:MAG TPA: phage holin family protein [Thermoanaerobaculia bacterium]|jgi:Zn-dependent protease with chaperone function|nr:phage holin family protein [Thermoanaerobaculia bacterium]
MGGWIDKFRSLGESLFAVLRAELAALQEDLTRSGRHLAVALGLMGGALVIFFWMTGLLIALLVAVLCIWLQLWAALLIVGLLFATAGGILGWLGLRQMKKVENPAETVRRHVDEHIDWLQNNLLRETPALDVAPARVGATNLDDDEEDLP